MSAFGYTPLGHVAGGGIALPPLGQPAAWRIMQAVYDTASLAELAATDDGAAAGVAVTDAVHAFVEAWWIRLGAHRFGLDARVRLRPDLVSRVLYAPGTRRFADTPEGLCWFVHELDIDRVDSEFLQHWSGTGDPPIIFGYRDPRDALLSMVDFLTGADADRLGHFADHHLYAAILRAAGTLDERLTIALSDPRFPGMEAFARTRWLMRHPRVCRVSFEELIGPEGGGSASAQEAAVSRLAGFLGVQADPCAVAPRLFNRNAHTFRHGRIGRWREHFTPDHVRLFAERYGDLADDVAGRLPG